MITKKLGELKIEKNADYYNEVVKVLEKAGFILVLECETTSERHYIVAEENINK